MSHDDGGVRCTMVRGGTSPGPFSAAADLPPGPPTTGLRTMESFHTHGAPPVDTATPAQPAQGGATRG